MRQNIWSCRAASTAHLTNRNEQEPTRMSWVAASTAVPLLLTCGSFPAIQGFCSPKRSLAEHRSCLSHSFVMFIMATKKLSIRPSSYHMPHFTAIVIDAILLIFKTGSFPFARDGEKTELIFNSLCWGFPTGNLQ